MRRACYPWDDQRDTRLKSLFASNRPYYAIADSLASEFPDEICINMVRRRCARLGLSRSELIRWTPEMDERLKQLVARPHATYREIFPTLNKEFGTSFTRCAVIGRARRIGIGAPAVVHTPEEIAARRLARQQRHNAARRGRRSHHGAAARAIRIPRPPVEETIMRCAAVEALHVSLLELEHQQCRWPYGEGVAITFCGHQKFNGFSYCAAHYFLSIGPGTRSEQMADRVSGRQLEAAE